jgi:hypothetical protein
MDKSGDVKLSEKSAVDYLKDLQEENKLNRTKISY